MDVATELMSSRILLKKVKCCRLDYSSRIFA